MGKRSDLGSSWSEVIKEWYLGNQPQVDEEVGWAALGTLERLWPEYVDELVRRGGRGPVLIGDAIETGDMLSTCESLGGFHRILERLRKGDPGVLSELKFAQLLVKRGYEPIFEPAVGTRMVDLGVTLDGRTVHVEIVSPGMSEQMKDYSQEMRVLADQLRESHPGSSIDVYLLSDPSMEVANKISTAVGERLLTTERVTLELPNTAIVRFSLFQRDLSSFDPVAQARPPVLGVASLSLGGQVSTRINVHLQVTDERAERIIYAESHHFSKDGVNLLVLDVSGVPGGIQTWVPLVQRRFQPTRNRRFGAIVLVSSAMLSSGSIETKIVVLENPHAHHQIPQKLLHDLRHGST